MCSMLPACHLDFTIITLVLGFTFSGGGGGVELRQGFTKIAQICPQTGDPASAS